MSGSRCPTVNSSKANPTHQSTEALGANSLNVQHTGTAPTLSRYPVAVLLLGGLPNEQETINHNAVPEQVEINPTKEPLICWLLLKQPTGPKCPRNRHRRASNHDSRHPTSPLAAGHRHRAATYILRLLPAWSKATLPRAWRIVGKHREDRASASAR
ncbi:uncharacterized protein BCR38DRAFT_411734 [Pseudomassariella vexata]|uniref:Uncharacterized protein n=1 Tax=Pseudomassariella vexata TaxID=1141098 RepID=A0A1Y2DMW1_9PEZI|nr:uncharacterized protein BCR38DRAFT_411734 [Pseudomassariella vexata]ORY60590.1 hypothetical protein BCR38DRAFT_411734 [Pseudomassariella vexata]